MRENNFKICIVYSGKESYGGIYTFWKNIINHSPKYFNYTFFSVTEKIPEFKTILKPIPLWLKKLAFKFNFHYYLTGFVVRKYLRQFLNYDVVIFNQPTAFPLAKHLKKRGIKTINVLHGSVKSASDAWKKERKWLYYLYYRFFWFFERLSGNSCDKVLTVSEFTKKNLFEEGIKKPIINCGFGIEVKNYNIKLTKSEKSELRKRYNFNSNDYILLFVGRFDQGKGSDKIINVMKKISKIKKNIKLLCVSKKPKNYKELLKYNIIFVNFMVPEKLIKIYKFSDLFLFPSRYEGYGSAVAEAMASGLPIIYSNTGMGYKLKELKLDGIYINPTNVKIDTIISQIMIEYKKRKRYNFSNIKEINLEYSIKKWINEIKFDEK